MTPGRRGLRISSGLTWTRSDGGLPGWLVGCGGTPFTRWSARRVFIQGRLVMGLGLAALSLPIRGNIR